MHRLSLTFAWDRFSIELPMFSPSNGCNTHVFLPRKVYRFVWDLNSGASRCPEIIRPLPIYVTKKKKDNGNGVDYCSETDHNRKPL
jgi:hypothetical protein